MIPGVQGCERVLSTVPENRRPKKPSKIQVKLVNKIIVEDNGNISEGEVFDINLEPSYIQRVEDIKPSDVIEVKPKRKRKKK